MSMSKTYLLLLLLAASNANATQYYFSQTGFEEGAYISGSFQATDLNGDGAYVGSIFSNFSEISDFSLSFSGNSIASAFTQSLADLTYLDYNASRSVIGDANPEGIATRWFETSGFSYVSGVGPNGRQGGDVINWTTGASSETGNLITVSTSAPVPLPGALGLFVPALVGLLGLSRRKHA